jgi:hypothetical protein
MSLRRRESFPAQRLDAVIAASRPVERAASEPPKIVWTPASTDSVLDIDSMYGDMKRAALRRPKKAHAKSMIIIELEPTASLWLANKEKYLDGRVFTNTEKIDYIMRSDGTPIGLITIDGEAVPAMKASISVIMNESKHIDANVTYFDASGKNLAVVKMAYHGFANGGDLVSMELLKVNRQNATPAMVKSTLDGDAQWMGFALFSLVFYEDTRFDIQDPSLDQVFMTK